MKTIASSPKQLKKDLLSSSSYVAEMLLSGRHTGELTELVRKLRLKFAMKDLGPTRHILGMKISISLNQPQFSSLFIKLRIFIRFEDVFNIFEKLLVFNCAIYIVQ